MKLLYLTRLYAASPEAAERVGLCHTLFSTLANVEALLQLHSARRWLDSLYRYEGTTS